MADEQTKLRILVIDDDPSILATLQDGLDLIGNFEVIVARDGVEGLERYFETEPDCVVVDVRMPRINGFHFVRAMRGDPKTAQVPIILLSAMVQDHEQFAGLLSGADIYLLKPVTTVQLIEAIHSMIARTQAEREEQQRRLSSDLAKKPEAK